MSWNLQRPSLEGLLAAVSCLGESVSWDLLLLQELSRGGEQWPLQAGSSLGGHLLYTNPSRVHDTAVLVHRRFVGKIAAVSHCDHAVSVTLRCGSQKIQCISAHHPDSWSSDLEQYEGATERISDLLQAGVDHTVVGLDANTEVFSEGDQPLRTVGPCFSGSARSDRQELLEAGLLWPHCLALLNTWPAPQGTSPCGAWTHL